MRAAPLRETLLRAGATRAHWRDRAIEALVALGVLLLGLLGLESAPPVWWDEGWTLCVARSLALEGHYGCMRAGEPAPSTLAAHFSVVAPIALSFRLLGVGIWQGRIAGLLLSVVALLLLYRLTVVLYSRRVGLMALIMLLALPAQWQLHPLIIGRQVLGEMPALCYLLGGYACFALAARQSAGYLAPALLLWGLAILTKLQVLPFWAISLLVPLGLTLLRREWRLAGLLAGGLAGGGAAAELLRWAQRVALQGRTLPGAPLSGMNETLSVVLVGEVRLEALRVLLFFGLPGMFGLGYAAWAWASGPLRRPVTTPAELLRLMLLLLAGGWMAWFALLSVGWPRYAFPALVLAAPFSAALLHDLSGGLRWRATLARAWRAVRSRRPWAAWQAIAALLLVGAMSLLAGRSALIFATSPHDRSVVAAAALINRVVPPGALIESYESELFFLLERPYTYPPAQVHVALIRRMFIDPGTPTGYDGPAPAADYLVIGEFASWTGLYTLALGSGEFAPYATVGSYQIYQRLKR